MLCENAIWTVPLEMGAVQVLRTVGSGCAPTSSGEISEKVPSTSRPGAIGDGSLTDSAASPAEEITFAVPDVV